MKGLAIGAALLGVLALEGCAGMDAKEQRVLSGAAIGTGAAAIAALLVAFVFRDQVPVPRAAARVGGLTLVYTGMALAGWAAWHLRSAVRDIVVPRRPDLVTSGPYRYVRHPLYLAMCIALLGAATVLRSWLGLCAVACLFLPTELYRARLEDRALAARFGSQWSTYARHTPFFVPGSR